MIFGRCVSDTIPILMAAIIHGHDSRVNSKYTGLKMRAARIALTPLSAYATVAKLSSTFGGKAV